MTRLHFAKPSLRRALWSVAVVAVACCVIVGLAESIGLIVTSRDTSPVPDGGEYVRLVVLCLTFWGPILVLTVWFISVPVILVLGLLIASVRRETDESTKQTPAG